MPTTLDRALLLRRFPYSESSLVTHALTQRHGRVHLLAKGAYRPTSRYFGALDLFDTLEIEWNEVAGRELQVVQAVRIETRRHRIAHDLARYSAALTVLELAGLGSPEGHAAPAAFELATRALDALLAGRAPDLALVEFELAFLHHLGLAPALAACASCGGPAPALEPEAGGSARAVFSAGAGGRLCRDCAIGARASGRRVGTLPVRTLDLAAELLRAVSADLETHEPRAMNDRAGRRTTEPLPEDLSLVRDAVARFVEYHLETRPKSYRALLAEPSPNRPA